jgi:hypothetical protein
MNKIKNQLISCNKYILLSVLILFLNTGAFCQDLLDSVNNNSKLINELKDIYRAFKINMNISDQNETINLFLNEKDYNGLNVQLKKFIDKCKSYENIQFYDSKLNLFIKNYIDATIKSYKIEIKAGIESEEFKSDYENYKKLKSDYMDYLMKNYSTEHFIKMSEDDYWKNIDKKNYIKSAEYSKYTKLKSKDINEAIKLLKKIIDKTNDFCELIIYQIELADQYVKNSEKLKDLGDETAIKKYKEILDIKKYSIYLFESWLKWRVVSQQNMGLSKTSDIPNDKYDKIRDQEALTVLKYISSHKNDEMAINEFTLFATHDIIKRFGDYPYGNQNTIEYHEIFDNIK